MVVRGLVEKPARIDTPVGTLADFGNYMTPKLSRRILHQLYLAIPTRRRPGGGAGRALDQRCAVATAERPARAVGSLRVPRPIKRAVRLVPGVHW